MTRRLRRWTLSTRWPPETVGESELPAPTGSCATIVVDEGVEVPPQTTLHLRAIDGPNPAARYVWRVVQPSGSVGSFQPSNTASAPTFEANVAGAYTLNLVVTDSRGVACEADPVVVMVVIGGALHIELLWHTPGDLEESDEGVGLGANLDLHLLAEESGRAFFDSIFDVYFVNANPNWGGVGTLDDCRLDRDDTDGAGPENINCEAPPAGCYTVGVHGHLDWGYGPSAATVRVYALGSLIFEGTHPSIVQDDLWTVTTVCWPVDSPPVLRHVCEKTGAVCGTDGDCTNGGRCGLDVVSHPLGD